MSIRGLPRGFTVGCALPRDTSLRTTTPSTTSTTSPLSHILHRSRVRLKVQHRVLVTSSGGSSAATAASASLRLRSPHQWSHIAHHSRRIPPTAMATSTTQKRSHAGHSHGGHHHHHDNTYLTSKNSSDPGVRITRIGLYVNLGMAIAKGTGGVVFNSQA